MFSLEMVGRIICESRRFHDHTRTPSSTLEALRDTEETPGETSAETLFSQAHLVAKKKDASDV